MGFHLFTLFLTSGDETEVQLMWNELFLSPEVAVALLGASVDVVVSFINKAHKCEPNWSTTKCAVSIERLIGAAMVAASLQDYVKCFLYSIKHKDSRQKGMTSHWLCASPSVSLPPPSSALGGVRFCDLICEFAYAHHFGLYICYFFVEVQF
eukprot:EG_transcript_33154